MSWKEAFEQCSAFNGRLFAPRYLSEWKEALLALRDGSQPSDDEVFWTGLFLINIGDVVSSYGETVSKFVSETSTDFFLPNNVLIRNQVREGQSQLKATFNGFALRNETELPYVCEYIGEFFKLKSYNFSQLLIYCLGDVCFENFTYLHGKCVKSISGTASEVQTKCRRDTYDFGSIINGISNHFQVRISVK